MNGWTIFCCSCGRSISVTNLNALPLAGWLFTEYGWTCGREGHHQVDDTRLFYRNNYDPTAMERVQNDHIC